MKQNAIVVSETTLVTRCASSVASSSAKRRATDRGEPKRAVAAC